MGLKAQRGLQALHKAVTFDSVSNIVAIAVSSIIGKEYSDDADLQFATVGDLKALPGFWNYPEVVEPLITSVIARLVRSLLEQGHQLNGEKTMHWISEMEADMVGPIRAKLTNQFGTTRGTPEQERALMQKMMLKLASHQQADNSVVV